MNNIYNVAKIALFSLFLSLNCKAQDQEVDMKLQKETDANSIYATPEISPEFPGGIMGFHAYVSQSYKIPVAFKGTGNVILSFVVEKDGSLTDIKIIRNLGNGTGEEAVRILKISPKWKPGIQEGVPVRVSYTLPIKLNVK